jgi:hypothetical protein
MATREERTYGRVDGHQASRYEKNDEDEREPENDQMSLTERDGKDLV